MADPRPPAINILPGDVLGEILYRAMWQFDAIPMSLDPALRGNKPSYQFSRSKVANERLSFAPGSVDPITLAQVCRSWRKLLTDTSMRRVWSTIKMRCTDHKRQAKMMRLWLKRSGSHPLTVWFESDAGENVPWEEKHIEPLKLLIKQFHRFRELRINLWRPLPDVLAGLYVDMFKILEFAEIRRYRTEKFVAGPRLTWKDSVGLWNAIHDSPALKEAVWDSDYTQHVVQCPYRSYMGASWESFQVLRIPWFNIYLAKVIMPLCTHLTELHLPNAFFARDWNIIQDPTGPFSPRLYFPRLKAFTLTGPCMTMGLLDQITLPAIEDFTLRVDDLKDVVRWGPDLAAQLASSIISLFARSGYPRLKRFKLTGLHEHDHWRIMGVLRKYGSLSELIELEVGCLDSTSMASEALTPLRDKKGEFLMCPGLEVLTLDGPQCKAKGHTNMLWSRSYMDTFISPLRSVVFRNWDPEPEDYQSIKVLAKRKPWIKFDVSSEDSGQGFACG